MIALGTVALAVVLSTSGDAYVEGPPPAATGGFGEENCAQCHFDGPINDPAGSLILSGIPEDGYVPAREYRIDILLSRQGLRRVGFELAARFAEGPDAGAQAGSMAAIDGSVDVVRSDTNSIQYARQNLSGSMPASEDSMIWSIQWQAPAAGSGPILLHVAANAANDDASELGDWIYATEARIPER